MVTRTSVSFLSLLISAFSFAHEIEQEDAQNAQDDNFKALVIPFYDPSIKSGLSIIPMYSFYADQSQENASKLSATFTYTESGSYNVRGNTDILLDKFRFVTDFGYNYSDLDVQFFEAARHKAATVQEEFNFFGDAYYGLTDSMFIGVGLSFESERYKGDTKRDEMQLIVANRCLSYCSDIGASLSFLIDKRDNYYAAHNGYLFSVTYESHQEWMGNEADATYSLLDTDMRYYFSLNDDETDTISARWLNRYLFDPENAPSNALSLYGRQGRDVQRGFIVGDYIPSANITSVEFEYRHRLSGTGYEMLDKTTLVTLAGAGKYYGRQANPLQKDTTFGTADTLSMVGFGLRYAVLPKERINVRMDVTYNNSGQWLVYFGLGENI